MVLLIYGTKETRNKIICVIDKDILFRKVMPALSEKNFKASDLYAYRILDTSNRNILYATAGTVPSHTFAKPDIEPPVFEQIRLPSFLQPTRLQSESSPRKYLQVHFIHQVTNTRSIRLAFAGRNRQPLFTYLLLQILNRDASLATFNGKATTKNTLISSAAQNLSDGLIRDQKMAEQYGTKIRYKLYKPDEPVPCDVAAAGTDLRSSQYLKIWYRT